MKDGLCVVKSSFNWIERAKSCEAFTSHTHTRLGVRESRALTQSYTMSNRQRKSLILVRGIERGVVSTGEEGGGAVRAVRARWDESMAVT